MNNSLEMELLLSNISELYKNNANTNYHDIHTYITKNNKEINLINIQSNFYQNKKDYEKRGIEITPYQDYLGIYLPDKDKYIPHILEENNIKIYLSIEQEQIYETSSKIIEYMYKKKIPSLFWSVESNTSAAGFLGILQERGGSTMYIPEASFISEKAPEKMGIALTTKSRPLACSKFKSMLEAGNIDLLSRELVRELNFFIDDSKNGKTHYAAKEGEHDDLITACFNVLLCYLKIKDNGIDMDTYVNNDTTMRYKRFNLNMPFLYSRF